MNDPPSGYNFGWGGSLSVGEDLALPFFRELSDAFLGDGMRELARDEPEKDWEFPRSFADDEEHGPRASFGGDALVLVVAVYLAAGTGDWVVGKVCDRIWEGIVRPRLARVLERFRTDAENGLNPGRVEFELDVWIRDDRLATRVKADVRPGDDFEKVMDAITEAQRQAFDAITTSGLKEAEATVPVREGAVEETKVRELPGEE